MMGSVTFGLPDVFFFLEKEQCRRLREQNYTREKSTMVFPATFQLKWSKKYCLFFLQPHHHLEYSYTDSPVGFPGFPVSLVEFFLFRVLVSAGNTVKKKTGKGRLKDNNRFGT